METYSDNWNACLLFRNKQLTKQLKNYQEASVLVDCSSSLLLAMSQLLRLHQHPSYGIVRDVPNGKICLPLSIGFMGTACRKSWLITV